MAPSDVVSPDMVMPEVAGDSMLKNRTSALTLTQFIVQAHGGDQQLAILMNAVQHACKVCANAIKKAGPCDLYGLAGTVNATDDEVKKLDVIANTVWVDVLKASGVCCLLVSEEEEQPIIIEDADNRGPFCVAFDP